MKESRDGVVQMEIFTESQMADILEFIYTDSIEISNLQKAQDLIAVADYLILERLKFAVQKFIAQNLSTANCISYYYYLALTHARYAGWHVGQQQRYSTPVCSGPASEQSPRCDGAS